jgi:hypothetical protein
MIVRAQPLLDVALGERAGRDAAARGLNTKSLDGGVGEAKTERLTHVADGSTLRYKTPAAFTSRTCSACVACHAGSRENQADFRWVGVAIRTTPTSTHPRAFWRPGRPLLRMKAR